MYKKGCPLKKIIALCYIPLIRKRKRIFSSGWDITFSIFFFIQKAQQWNQWHRPTGFTAESEGAGHQWAAERETGNIPDPEATSWGADPGKRLWKTWGTWCRKWGCGHEGHPQTLWNHNGEKGEDLI